jgi:hypothetical protein
LELMMLIRMLGHRPQAISSSDRFLSKLHWSNQ